MIWDVTLKSSSSTAAPWKHQCQDLRFDATAASVVQQGLCCIVAVLLWQYGGRWCFRLGVWLMFAVSRVQSGGLVWLAASAVFGDALDGFG